MDLSHMIGLWLVGQGPGVGPGGVGVVYAPPAVGAEPGGEGRGGGEAKGNGVYPFSAGRLGLGADPTASKHVPAVVRAGVALIGELEYGPEGLDGFVPRLFSAVHLPAASHTTTGGPLGAQANRGEASIGLSEQMQFVDRFDAAGVLGRARVVGYVERARGGGAGGGELVQTSEDIAVANFPVMFEKLGDYLRFQVSAQVAGNGYDDLAGALARSDRPAHAVVVVGVAGADPHLLGAQVRLRAWDVCHSVVYDGGAVTREAIEEALGSGQTGVLGGEGVSWLRQVVE